MTKRLTKYDKERLFSEFEEYISRKEGPRVPLYIFEKKLTVLESVIKFLVDHENKGYAQIGRLLNKDRQVIWKTYKRASAKSALKKEPSQIAMTVPLDIFSDNRFSASESLVSYLKEEEGMDNKEIADLLHKDSKTIWTWLSRYKKKNE